MSYLNVPSRLTDKLYREIGVRVEDASKAAARTAKRGRMSCWMKSSACEDLRIGTHFELQGEVFLVADAGDPEANAAALILLHKIEFNFATKAFCTSLHLQEDDWLSKAIDKLDSEDTKVGAVLLSRRLFHEPTNVYAVTAVLHAFDETRVELVPISVHLFEFPGPSFYSGVLPACLGATSEALREQMIAREVKTARQLQTDPQVVELMLKRMFVVVCSAFNTHASDVTITGQASDVLQRFRSRSSVKSHVAGTVSKEVKARLEGAESRGCRDSTPAMCSISIAPIWLRSQLLGSPIPSLQLKDANTEQNGVQEQQLDDVRQWEEEIRHLKNMLDERNREIATLHAMHANGQFEEKEDPATPRVSTRL